jgi:acetyltransferase
VGYKGRIYPVNPNYSDIEGLPCYPSLDTIPQPVDLAILFIPAPSVPGVLETCARKGIRRVMIQSAGFAEVGPEGTRIQSRCSEIARQAGIRIWGPNCMGLVDVHNRTYLSFMHPRIHEAGLTPGPVSLIVQSGMLSAGFLADLAGRGIAGIAKACSIGNRMDVDECDLMEYLLEDEQTRVIALYLESVPRGRRLVEMARGSPKPILLLLGGRSRSGAKAALSHTSSLAGDARLSASVLQGAGILLMEDFHQMMETAEGLAMLPPLGNPCRVAILTFSGGAGILSCDLLEREGFVIHELAETTKKEIRRVFPPWMPVANPVDLYPALELHGRVKAYHEALSAVLRDPGFDVVLIHYFAGLERKDLDLPAIRDEARQRGKGVLFWVIGLAEEVAAFQKKAKAVGLPVYRELLRAAEALTAARSWTATQRATPRRGHPHGDPASTERRIRA